VYLKLLKDKVSPEEYREIMNVEKPNRDAEAGKVVYGQREIVLDGSTGNSMSLVWFSVDG
jgi:hypothetical protein